MQLRTAYSCKHDTITIEIEDDFDNSFWYDVFVLKGSNSLCLPDALDHIFMMWKIRYVKVSVQMEGYMSSAILLVEVKPIA